MGISSKFIKFIKSEQLFGFVALLFCLLMPVFTSAQENDRITTVNGKKYYMHNVGKGETIYGIAQKYNLQPKDIVLENPSAIDGVKAGDVLLLPIVSASKTKDTTAATPVVNSTPEKPGQWFYHEVEPKETLYSLSKKFNTTISAIDSLNPEITLKGLQKGQKIRIPTAQTQVVNKPTPKDSVKKNTPPKPIMDKINVGTDSAKNQPKNNNTEVKKTPDESKAYKNLVIEQTHADTAKPVAPIKDTGKKLNRYNIALILPFSPGGSDTLRISKLLAETEQIPQMTQISVDYYHGIVLALDSLAKKGLKANLHLYNVLPGSDSISRSVDSILRNPELATMNLIIGPPSPAHFKRVARFADLHHIPIVSPLSGENSLLKNNPYASKITPSAITETEATADYIASHYNHANLIIIHNKTANDEYYEVFKKRFKKTDSVLGHTDTLCRTESTGNVFAIGYKISRKGLNIIIVPYMGESFVAKFVNDIANSSYAKDDSIILFGMHKWANNDALEPNNLDTLNFHFPSNEFVNYSDSNTKKFITRYRYYYLSEPTYYSYQGFDAGIFYGGLLQAFGTDMQNHLGDKKFRGLQTSFDMYRSNPANGYENKTVYILEYRNYTVKLDSR